MNFETFPAANKLPGYTKSYMGANILLPFHGQQNAFRASGGKELHQHNFPTPHHTLAGRQNASRKRFTHLCLITSGGEHFTCETLSLGNTYARFQQIIADISTKQKVC